jgi:hypothetical protein
LILIVDDISGPPGEHDVEQFWHPGSPEAQACLVFSEPAEAIDSWVSLVFADKRPSRALRIQRRCALPACFAAAIKLAPEDHIEIQFGEGKPVFLWQPAGGSASRFAFD